MPLTVSTSPVRPVPNRLVRLSFAGAASGTDYVRVYATQAPKKTALRTELDQLGVSRVLIGEGDLAEGIAFTPEMGGKYTLTVEEYRKGATPGGGGWLGSESGHRTETQQAVTTGLTVTVGTRLRIRLGAGPHQALLVLYLFDDTIARTTFGEQGENTPAIIDPTTDEAAAAGVAAEAAVAALAGLTATAAVGDPIGVMRDLITKYEAHRVLTAGSVHAAADNDNKITGFGTVRSFGGGTVVTSFLITRLMRHMINDKDGSGAGSATSAYHGAGADFTSTPLLKSPPVNGAAEVSATIASTWIAYEDHRVNVESHGAVDATNVLAALPPLLAVHRDFLLQLRSATPSSPSDDHSGIGLLFARAGAIKNPS